VFRPHFKTHQSLTIGRWFRDAGVSRITVSSLFSADFFAQDGWDDITIAFPVNLREIGLINKLAETSRIGLLLEHAAVASELEERLEYPVDAYIKIDTGYHRTGLALDELPAILDLASVIRSGSKMNLKGLLTHAGHTYHASAPSEILDIYSASTTMLLTVREKMGDHFSELTLSYGDTPSCTLVEGFTGIDEIRPGNFIFYDLMQMVAGICRPDQIAGILVCPVAAIHPARNQAVLYGGAVHLSKEFILVNGHRVYGQMVEMDDNGWYNPIPDAYVVSLSQEHGILEAPDFVVKNLHPGGIVGIIPVHSCLTANLIRGYQLPDGGTADYDQRI
jgi:D-serine deaminase-like pyridoxal phosphate-dependent protein